MAKPENTSYNAGSLPETVTEDLCEGWRDVPGYPGYSVSSHGRMIGRHKRLLALTPDARGYSTVTLMLNGVRHPSRVHRIVALAFLGPCPEGMRVYHNDLDNSNNRLDNLCYDTPLGRAYGPLLTPVKVLRIRKMVQRIGSYSYVARAFNIGSYRITSIARGDSYKDYPGPITLITKPGTHKLTQHKAEQIRQQYATDTISMAKLGKEFGVSESMISRIINNNRWVKD